MGPGLESWGLASLSRVYTDPGAEGAGPPSFPPGRTARPTHLRGRQPRPHLPHQEGLQAAARGAEKPGARCRPPAGICPQRRHDGPRAAPRLGVTWPGGARGASPSSRRCARGPQGRVEPEARGRGEPRVGLGVRSPGRGGCGSSWLAAWNFLIRHVELFRMTDGLDTIGTCYWIYKKIRINLIHLSSF